ncbi:MAG: GNAT family N-acetyltransferase [Acidobacteriota bacterium]
MTYPFIELALAQRLERTEAAANARFVEARANIDPNRQATWQDVQGTWAMFDGVGSPLTQSFGLGMFAEPDAPTLDALEAFFRDRGAAVDHEVSALALGSPLPLLSSRGYAPIELTSVMFRPASLGGNAVTPAATAPRTRLTGPEEGAAWADAAADGWSEVPELVPFVREISTVFAQAAGAHCFAAEVDGTLAAAGVLAVHDGVALLAGASTRPAFRRRGAQLALLRARLQHAEALGCDLAMMCASPGSASQRNAERNGFRIAYTRIKWRLSR